MSSKSDKVFEKTEIRIVAGSLKGRKITAFVHEGLRPTPQLVREALFSILGNAIPGRIFIDLFAGTGVVGIEAISRGAASALLIEGSREHAAEIQKTIARFQIGEQVQVVKADGYRWAERWIVPVRSGPINVFFSPPFPDLEATKVKAFINLVHTLLDKVPDESVLTIQAEDGFPVDQLPEPAKWDIRKYGRNLLLFLVKESPPAHDEQLSSAE